MPPPTSPIGVDARMPSGGSGTGSWLAGYAPLITPIVSVGLSAAVSWITANYITRKSNLRAAFDRILSQLDDVHSAATDLLLSPGADPQIQTKSRTVVLTDHRLGRGLTEVFRVYPAGHGTTAMAPVPHQIVQARIALRKLVTDSDLAQPTRAAFEANAKVFEELDQRCEVLRCAIREAAEDLGAGDL